MFHLLKFPVLFPKADQSSLPGDRPTDEREMGALSERPGVSYLLTTVPYDGQVEKLAAMLLGQDGVHARCTGAHKLLIGTEVIR